MSSTKKDNIKESTNQFKESTNKYIDEQNQQIKNTTSNLSKTTDKINESVNKFQDNNRGIIEKMRILSGDIKNKSTKHHKKYQITL